MNLLENQNELHNTTQESTDLENWEKIVDFTNQGGVPASEILEAIKKMKRDGL